MRAPALFVVLTAISGCWSTEPDYVGMTRGVQCDVRSQLVRRGYPENLDAVLAGNCTVTRMDPMRGPDFTRWLAGASSAINSCDTPFPIPFWTEKSPEGKITRVHFCPEYCDELRATLQMQIKQDLVCQDDAGVDASTALPPTAGSVATVPDGGLFPPVGGSAAGAFAAGSGGVVAGAAAAGGGGSFAGNGGTSVLPTAGGAAAAAGIGGAAGTGGAAAANAPIAGTGVPAGGAGAPAAGTGGVAGAGSI